MLWQRSAFTCWIIEPSSRQDGFDLAVNGQISNYPYKCPLTYEQRYRVRHESLKQYSMDGKTSDSLIVIINLYSYYYSKVWMKGFLPSQWYVPVSTLLPVSKVLSFSPPQRSWFPSRIPGKLSHIRRISQGQVFSHSEGSRSRLQKKKKKI